MTKLLLLFTFLSLYSQAETIRTEKCKKDVTSPFLYQEDFKWGMTLKELAEKEIEIYRSGKRLKERAYTRDGKIYFPYEDQEIEISTMFVEGIVSQVEMAFAKNYVDALIFPDMGHSHFFIPMDIYKNDLRPLTKNRKLMYERLYNLPELKVLYHTAEQVKMVDENKNLINDPDLIWRYETRNLVGGMNGEKLDVPVNETHTYNTVRKYGEEGEYYYWGAGFNISGSKDGCFSYQRDGKTFFFDISLKDLQPQSKTWSY